MTSALVGEEEEERVPDMFGADIPEAAEVVGAEGLGSEANTPRELVSEEGENLAQEFDKVQVEETSASPVLEESELVVEEEPIETNEPVYAEQAPPPSPARDAWKAETEDRMVQKQKEEAERKRELIENGQAELENMMKELNEQSMKRRQAAVEESQRRAQDSAALGCTPGVERTRGETWSLVCDLIDFKRDTKADLSKYKSLIIQLKHSSSGD